MAKGIDRLEAKLQSIALRSEERERDLLETIKGMDDKYRALVDAFREKAEAQSVELGKLGVRAGFLGACAGGVPVVVLIAWEILKRSTQ